MNNVMQMLMSQLKSVNPQAVQQIERLRQSNGSPEELLKEATGNYSPEQMNKFREFAKGFGISDEQLNQYGINVK